LQQGRQEVEGVVQGGGGDVAADRQERE
jgi:hypothetical protein